LQSAFFKPVVSSGDLTLYRATPVVGQIDTLVDTGVGGFARFTPIPGALGSRSGIDRTWVPATSSRAPRWPRKR
jgi:hypothetical protein